MQMLEQEYRVGDTFAYTIQSVTEEGCDREVAADLDSSLTITGKIKQADNSYINITVTPDPDQVLNKGVLQVIADSPLTVAGLSRVQFVFDYATTPPIITSDQIYGFYVEEAL